MRSVLTTGKSPGIALRIAFAAAIVCCSMCLVGGADLFSPLWVLPSFPLAMLIVVCVRLVAKKGNAKRIACHFEARWSSLLIELASLWVLLLVTEACSAALDSSIVSTGGAVLAPWIPVVGGLAMATLYLAAVDAPPSNEAKGGRPSFEALSLGQMPLIDSAVAIVLADNDAAADLVAMALVALTLVWLLVSARLVSSARACDVKVSLLGMLASGFAAEQFWDFYSYRAAWPVGIVAMLTSAILTLIIDRLMSVSAASACEEGVSAPDSDRSSLLNALAMKPLSPQEQIVLSEMLQGKTGKEIAAQMGVSESSVATFRKRGYEKLGVKKKAELFDLLADASALEPERASRQPINEKGVDGACPWLPVALALAALVAPPPPDNAPFIGVEYWLDWRPFIGRLVCLMLSLVLLREEEGNSRPSATVADLRRLSPFACLLWAAACLVCSWGYSPVAFRLLALALFVATLPNDLAGEEVSIYGREWAARLRLPSSIALIASGIGLEPYLDYLTFGDRSGSSVLFPIGIGLLVYRLFEARQSRAMRVLPNRRLPERQWARVRSYLLGRGMGELQVECVILILMGWSVEATAQKANVAESTVRSYCYRTCMMFNVTSMKEVSHLVSQETKIGI